MIMVFESMMTYWKCNDINAKVKENPLYAHCMPLCVMTCGKSFMCYKCLHVRSMMTCNSGKCDIKCYMMLCKARDKYMNCTSISVHVKCD